MPFKSKSQQRFMFARHPKIAKRWAKKYGISRSLPEKKRTFKKGSPNTAVGIHCLRAVGAYK